jgi:hypothetical protein
MSILNVTDLVIHRHAGSVPGKGLSELSVLPQASLLPRRNCEACVRL